MSKNTEEIKKIQDKLDYLDLNLEKIPKVLKDFEPISFRPSKAYDDTTYKVYKYIPINDIEILLTPADRLTNLDQKYKLSAPISAYLDSKSEENLERFATFLNLLNEMNISEIEKIGAEQEKLLKTIPYEIKYANNYIWQIYYSDISNKYFMLVPTNESNNSALFYLLKKKIQNSKKKKNEYIFAPVTHMQYSGNFLLQSQITDIENYMWYFTKNWSNIFEVYDLKDNMNIKIIGKIKVYEEIETKCVITLKTKEEALKWYKLIKALFILATAMSEYYEFEMRVSENGELEFFNNINEKMEYSNLPKFIKSQVDEKKVLAQLESKKIDENNIELKELKQIIEEQTEEFLNKERQIAMFLACKKSFIGKVKYYFGNRKKHAGTLESFKAKKEKNAQEKENDKNEEQLLIDIQENSNINENAKDELIEKESYTIEDLIDICTKLEDRKKALKNLDIDKKALELKKVNLERKIKNANIYLNEIELHKKSIFEFWKFASKDELPGLNEGEELENDKKEKLGKSFNFEEDIEDLGKQMDELQRRKLSKNELDSIFAIKHALKSCQILEQTNSNDLSKEEIKELEKELESLKKQYKENIEIVINKDFDIFGSIVDDVTKVKNLNNEKHREIEKDKYKVLNISQNTELNVYIDNLRNSINLAKEALHKISTPFEMPVYIAKIVNNSDEILNNLETENEQKECIDEVNLNTLQIANINGTQELYEKAECAIKEGKSISFYKLNLLQNAPVVYYTNSVFYDNYNKTLPLGMNVTTEVLINLNQYKLKKENERIFRINYQIDEYTNKVVEVYGINFTVGTDGGTRTHMVSR